MNEGVWESLKAHLEIEIKIGIFVLLQFDEEVAPALVLLIVGEGWDILKRWEIVGLDGLHFKAILK